MTTGVCNKPDFQFEIRDGKPIMFLHNVEANTANIQIAANLFKMIKNEEGLDFANLELRTKLQGIANTIGKDFKKQKTVLDKCYNEQLKSMASTNDLMNDLFTGLLRIKY
jgi:hypothetical protein